MQKTIQRSQERGVANYGWLQAKYSFSFADYFNPQRLGFGPLLVFNNDSITAAQGFDPHTHRNMEIITIPLHGQLLHTDSTGAEEIIRQGQIQVMSAGSGITHSEYNHSQTKNLELFQIWIEPNQMQVPPRHETRDFFLTKNTLTQIVSGNKQDECAFMYQDASLFLGKFNAHHLLSVPLKKERGIFLFIIEGSINIENEILNEKDSIELSNTQSAVSIDIKMISPAYILLIDLPIFNFSHNKAPE